MSGPEGIGRVMLVVGGLFLIIGLLLTVGGRFFPLGRLPGDIYIQRGNFTFYFPLMTGLLLSLILTFIVNMLGRR